jgi:hypothetical protein
MQAFRIACLLVVSVMGVAQQTPPPAPAAPKTQAEADAQPATGAAAANSQAEGAPALPADLQAVVTKQFGPNFTITKQRNITVRYLHQPERPPLNTLLVGDLDGDGVEDAVILARAKNVFSGQLPFGYAVIDPYFTAYGYGNPKITAGMAEEYPEGNYMVLVIHGAGPEGWRAEHPKAKFVMINLPFNTINVAPITLDKKHKFKKVTAIILEEDGTNQSSLVVWDGRKYRWRDMGGPGE